MTTRREMRFDRFSSVVDEYNAARSAVELLREKVKADPNFGDGRGWRRRAAGDLEKNLDATFIIRLYAEFEAALRDYWTTHLRKSTQPKMEQLLNRSIPNQFFRRIASTWPTRSGSTGTSWFMTSRLPRPTIWRSLRLPKRNGACVRTSLVSIPSGDRGRNPPAADLESAPAAAGCSRPDEPRSSRSVSIEDLGRDRSSVAERLQLVEESWDSVAATPDAIELTDAQKLDLQRRLDADRDGPGAGSPWEEIKRRLPFVGV